MIKEIEKHNLEIVKKCANCGSKNINLRFEEEYEFYEYPRVTIVCGDCGTKGKSQFIVYLIDKVEWDL